VPDTRPVPRLRLGALGAARVALLAGPTVLAFWSGGYFDTPRAVAGLVAWLLVAVALVAGEPLSRARSSRLALGGLALLGVWTLISIIWAPAAGAAYHSGQRVLLYTGALLAASMLLRSPRWLRAVEPSLAAGALIVIGYGLSERLLPGLLHFQSSHSALGRLEQPLTYWNAMGEVAAIGLVLCARLAGDQERRSGVRLVAASASVPLGLGLYLSFSRGALFACAAGLATLIVAAPQRQQLRGALVTLLAAVLGALVATPFHSLTTLLGSASHRQSQGLLALLTLVVIGILAAIAERAFVIRGRTGAARMPKRAPWIAFALICAGLALALVGGSKERSISPLSTGATRYATLQSNRYAYWRVAWHAFSDAPVRGVGAGGWAVYWLRLRRINDFAADAHSLPIQTLAELGLVGLALLAAFLAGLGLVARDAMRAAAGPAAGLLAGLVAYLAHAPLDWDWEMPAVTLIALVLAGGLAAVADQAAILARGRGETPDDTGELSGAQSMHSATPVPGH
jgi:O-antigen ligase